MAILDLITCGEKEIFSVDTDPSVSGFLASIGSIAMFNDNGVGKLFIKTGESNTNWKPIYSGDIDDLRENVEDIVANLIKNTASIKWLYNDSFNNLKAIVDPSGVPHNELSNVQSAAFGVTHGHITDQEQTIAGRKIFQNEVVINGDLTVFGNTTSIEATNLEISDRVITLNKGGGFDSAIGSGIEVDIGPSRVQFIKIDEEFIEFNSLTSTDSLKVMISPNTTVTFEGSNSLVYGYNGNIQLPSQGYIPYFNKTNGFGEFRNSPLYFDPNSTRFGIGTTNPKGIFHRHYFYESPILGVTTTSATPVTAYSIVVPNNTIINIEVRINGRQTEGSSGSINFARSYIRTALVKNINGNVTLVKLQSDFTAEDESTGDVSISVVGDEIRVYVIGGAGRTIKWYGQVFVLETPAT